MALPFPPRIAVFAALLAMSAASWLGGASPLEETPVDVKKEIGDRNFQILQGATRVQAFRIHAPPLRLDDCGPATQPSEKFGRYYIIDETAKEQGKEFAARLTAVLRDSKTYDDHNALCFSPGFAYRIWKDQQSVDALICFECHHVRLGGRLLNLSATQGLGPLKKLVDESFPPKDVKGK